MELGIFRLDFNSWIAFFSEHSTTAILLRIFTLGGWLVLVWLFLYLMFFYWQEYKEEQYKKDWQWVLLAIDIPALNVQTPKAVEQMFAHLAGAFDSPNIADRFRSGYKQRWFSFEIISIEGYIQFLVRTEQKFRDLVEAAVYAQYADAEITEVEDYVDSIPDSYPNDTHDIWVADFSLAENDAYPIRTYQEFEHSISKDTVLKDPMGTLLESFTRIGPGEQMWFQLLVEPIGNGWKEKSIKKIKEVIGEKQAPGKGIFDFATDNFLAKELGAGLSEINAQLTGVPPGEAAESKDNGPPNQLQYLTPGQTKLVEAMEAKIMKIGLKTKIRGVYVARKEVFRPERGVQALIGAINQFNIPSANSIVPVFGVGTSYAFKSVRSAYRKKLLTQAYKKRKMGAGGKPFVLNIEELATVWHFPMSHVKTPLLQKAEGKRAEPPPGLPVESVPSPFDKDQKKEEEKRPQFRTDAGDVGYGENMRFG